MARIVVSIKAPAMRSALAHAKLRAEAFVTEVRDEIVLQMDPGPGPRTGLEYPKPDAKGTYTASAPGEPPAVRTGQYANSWQVLPPVVQGDRIYAAAQSDATTESGESLGALLEYGTNKMAPRPHIRPAVEIVKQRHGIP